MHQSWTRDDLFLAYRHAKSALFFDRRGVGLIDLARFEQDLDRRLLALHRRLRSSDGWFDDLPLGSVWAVPKKLRRKPRRTPRSGVVRVGHETLSDPTQIELQLRLSPSPESAIVEVLFLWQFGPALESLISRHSVGRRLSLERNRIRKTQPRLFQFWQKQYNAFRTAPIRAAQAEIRRQGSVLLISADLTSFYDSVDANFLLSEDFAQLLQDSEHNEDVAPIDIEAYDSAVRSLLRFYSRFRRTASSYTGEQLPVGVPIGSLTGHIVANLALANLDRAVQSRRTTVCYRRYVDDIIIVSRFVPTSDKKTQGHTP